MNRSKRRAPVPRPRDRGTIHILLSYLRPQAGKASLMAACLIVGIGLQLGIPQLLRDFIDSATMGEPLGELRSLAILFLAVAMGHQLLAAVATYLGADVGWTATNRLRSELARHVLSLDMSFHTSRTAGEMIERIDGDITALSNFFSQFSVRVFGGLLLLLGILVLLWLESPLVGLPLTVFTVLELILLARTRRLGVPATVAEREANARLFGFIEERLAGIDDVRANGAGAHTMHRFLPVMRDFVRGTRRAWIMRSVVWLTSYGFFVVASFTLLATVIVLVRQGVITLGTGYMVFQYLLMLQTPIDQITQQLQELQKAGAGLGRVRDLLDERPEEIPEPGKGLPPGPLSVEFDQVAFRYQGDGDPQLEDVSFHLPPGSVLGLIGRTGSGKTTLTRLLFRLYRPTRGSIRLGGVELAELGSHDLHEGVGLVTQDVQLFGATVRDNLTFFRRDLPDERLIELLSDVGLGRWFEGLERGLDTEIAPGGGNLSAGEAQLLAFARVFLKDPGLVVLDEPSSRLDPLSEARLERAVDRLLTGRTAIVIAHRLETLARADYIMVLSRGRVVEFGDRRRLAADPGSRYARMLLAGVSPGANPQAGPESPATHSPRKAVS